MNAMNGNFARLENDFFWPKFGKNSDFFRITLVPVLDNFFVFIQFFFWLSQTLKSCLIQIWSCFSPY